MISVTKLNVEKDITECIKKIFGQRYGYVYHFVVLSRPKKGKDLTKTFIYYGFKMIPSSFDVYRSQIILPLYKGNLGL